MPSSFLNPSTRSKPDDPAVLHLRRDLTTATILRSYDDENQGYKEGKVSNTRFGSFPHSTLIGQPWGSQIIASKVDTGSRGRRGKSSSAPPSKRKADDLDSPAADDTTDNAQPLKTAQAASCGFLHLLYPTPETWTASLPHRTQVVYTPDYSYILHRLRARPGQTIIEAGAGSGSFTHAAARAVFNGYASAPGPKRRKLGKVYSFEFHEQRVGRVQQEIQDHGLSGLVEVTHRDVYSDGFLLPPTSTGEADTTADSNSSTNTPKANAIFLDLPAPWLALKHLVRNPSNGKPSPLDPSTPVYICTFSPCLEQAERTISTLRQMNWLSIEMVEINHRRIETKRDYVGLDADAVRGGIMHPSSVDEAVNRMRALEKQVKQFREIQAQTQSRGQGQTQAEDDMSVGGNGAEDGNENENEEANTSAPKIPPHRMGRVVHRSEPDLKTHTSYLVFAILPQEWTEEDEKRCRQIWPSGSLEESEQTQKSNKQIKREKRAKAKQEQGGSRLE